MQQDIPEEESTVASHSNIPNSVVDQERGENLVANSPKRGSSTVTKSVENVDTNQTITDDEMTQDLKSDDVFTSQQTLLQLAKEQDPDLFVLADDADISADSTLSLDVHLNKRSTKSKSKLGFYVPFNSQGHIGTGPQNCHLWDSNPQR